MTVGDATRITSRIRLLVDQISDNTDKVIGLVEQAQAGKAWEALGYASWPAYVTTEFRGALARLEKAVRQPVVLKLAETGLSSRAIATVTGVSKDTVRADIQLATPSQLPNEVISLDGKARPRRASFLPSGKADAASTEDMGQALPEATRRSRPAPAACPNAKARTVREIATRVTEFSEVVLVVAADPWMQKVNEKVRSDSADELRTALRNFQRAVAAFEESGGAV